MLSIYILTLTAVTIILIMELLFLYLKHRNIKKANTTTYRLVIINKKTKEMMCREYILNNVYFQSMEYTAVMNIIKELKLYHLCPYINLMLRPGGLNGRTYKIYVKTL